MEKQTVDCILVAILLSLHYGRAVYGRMNGDRQAFRLHGSLIDRLVSSRSEMPDKQPGGQCAESSQMIDTILLLWMPFSFLFPSYPNQPELFVYPSLRCLLKNVLQVQE